MFGPLRSGLHNTNLTCVFCDARATLPKTVVPSCEPEVCPIESFGGPVVRSPVHPGTRPWCVGIEPSPIPASTVTRLTSNPTRRTPTRTRGRVACAQKTTAHRRDAAECARSECLKRKGGAGKTAPLTRIIFSWDARGFRGSPLHTWTPPRKHQALLPRPRRLLLHRRHEPRRSREPAVHARRARVPVRRGLGRQLGRGAGQGARLPQSASSISATRNLNCASRDFSVVSPDYDSPHPIHHPPPRLPTLQ